MTFDEILQILSSAYLSLLGIVGTMLYRSAARL